MRNPIAVSIAIMTVVAAQSATAQIPEKFENLKVLPKDVSRAELLSTMRGFALGLGVRCEYCHAEKTGAAPGPGGRVPLDFALDRKPTKEKARFMLRMARTINDSLLVKLTERRDPPVRVQCVTCHRGSSVPRTLDALLVQTTTEQGADSAVALYRNLRETALTSGRYNFDEITLLEVASDLSAADKTDAALRMLRLNQEFFPASSQIEFELGEVYRQRGEKENAIAHYRKALEKSPNNTQAKRRLKELGVS